LIGVVIILIAAYVNILSYVQFILSLPKGSLLQRSKLIILNFGIVKF